MTLETRYARSGDVNIAYQVVGDARRQFVERCQQEWGGPVGLDDR
jgi:hypothetical protein